MNFKLFLLLFFSVVLSGAQNSSNSTNAELYKDYREDQFYASITYNLLTQKSDSISQNGFSSGFHFGFIRDMPVNEERTKAIGIGLGVSANSYNQNISILETNNETNYSIINEEEINVSKNKFTTYLIEVPIEFRWRNSTATDYSFWRIYTGFKLGYLLYNSSKFKSTSGNQNLSNISDFNAFQYGLTLSIGYGTWNIHAYYALNPIFKNSAQIDNRSIDIRAFKIGLMFYIL
ncbi:MAG: PorT family protein [Winogradskyella sp.]|uniref:porin family protein n=1 Tax=Winogradskyella sp. TaxID=1883156 RepID=UPI0017E3843C|nr:PorT family protein [Winogradskyella sp.]